MTTEHERLGMQVEALRTERDAAREAVEVARRTLEETRTEVDARTKLRIAERSQRQRLVAIVAMVSIVGTALGAFVALTYVSDETLHGEISEVSGAPPASVGEACVARVGPGYFPRNGVLQIDCATLRLYGSESSGALSCETEGHRAVRCADEGGIDDDGDPRVILDRAARRLTVDDGSSWRIEITLSDDG